MGTQLLAFLKELIEGGFLGQAVVGTFVWVLIGYLIVTKTPIENRLWDAGLIIIGYLFHMAQTAVASKAKATVAKLEDCNGDTRGDE